MIYWLRREVNVHAPRCHEQSLDGIECMRHATYLWEATFIFGPHRRYGGRSGWIDMHKVNHLPTMSTTKSSVSLSSLGRVSIDLPKGESLFFSLTLHNLIKMPRPK